MRKKYRNWENTYDYRYEARKTKMLSNRKSEYFGDLEGSVELKRAYHLRQTRFMNI